MNYTIQDVKIGQVFRYKEGRYDLVIEVTRFGENSSKFDNGIVVIGTVIESISGHYNVGDKYSQGGFTLHWNTGKFTLISDIPPPKVKSRIALL